MALVLSLISCRRLAPATSHGFAKGVPALPTVVLHDRGVGAGVAQVTLWPPCRVGGARREGGVGQPALSLILARVNPAGPNPVCPSTGAPGGPREPYSKDPLSPAEIACLPWWVFEITK
jgi:hypothetical protein